MYGDDNDDDDDDDDDDGDDGDDGDGDSDDNDEPLKRTIHQKKLVENLFLYSNILDSSKHNDSLIRGK